MRVRATRIPQHYVITRDHAKALIGSSAMVSVGIAEILHKAVIRYVKYCIVFYSFRLTLIFLLLKSNLKELTQFKSCAVNNIYYAKEIYYSQSKQNIIIVNKRRGVTKTIISTHEYAWNGGRTIKSAS